MQHVEQMTAPAYATRRPSTEGVFSTHDGVALFYRHWPAVNGAAKGAIAALPSRSRALRPHGASRRRARPAGLTTSSPGMRAAMAARPASAAIAPSFGDLRARRADLRASTSPDPRSCRERHGGRRAERRRGPCRDLGARLRAEDPRPGAGLAGLPGQALRALRASGPRLWQKLRGPFFVKSYVKARFLTHDPERIASFDADPLITRADRGQHPARALRHRRARSSPTRARSRCRRSCSISGADLVVHHGPQHRFFERSASPTKERHVLPGFFHDTLGERDRGGGGRSRPALHPGRGSRKAGAGRRSARCATAAATPATRPTGSRRRSHALSPRGLYWALTRLGLRVGEAWSRRAPHRSPDRLRFGLDARLRLPERAAGRGALGAPDRPHLSRLASAGAASASARCMLEELIRERHDAPAGGGDARPHRRHRRRAMAATCSTRSRPGTSGSPDSHPAARLQRINVDARAQADRREEDLAGDRVASSRATPSTRRACGHRVRRRPSPSSPASTSSFPTTTWSPLAAAASPRRCRRAATSSTPTSPGTRSSR